MIKNILYFIIKNDLCPHCFVGIHNKLFEKVRKITKIDLPNALTASYLQLKTTLDVEIRANLSKIVYTTCIGKHKPHVVKSNHLSLRSKFKIHKYRYNVHAILVI